MKLKLKKNIQVVLLILLILIILIILGIIIINKVFKNKTISDPEISTSFFIKNDEGNYALFNEKGKQITDFIYSYSDGFYNGVSRVANTSGDAGIINEDGKYIVELGEYDSVIQYGSLFKVSDDDNTYLLNYKGKKIETSFEIKATSLNDMSLLISVDDNYILYNYLGKKIETFDKTDDENILITSTDEYGILYLNNNSYLFNSKTAKIIKEVSNEEVCINSYDDDTFILETCSITDDEQTTNYKVLKDNKLYDIDECDTVSFKNNNFICKYNNISYLLDDDFNKADITLSSSSYHDINNYAIESDNNIKIIKNGKEVKVIEDAILVDKGYVEEYYLINKNDKYYYYNLSGKQVFDEYSYAYSFDSNNLAKVSIDEDNYYFINNKGKKVSNTFTEANQHKNYYIVTIDDRLGVINNKGKIVIECMYDDVEIVIINDIYYAKLKNGEITYLYNLDNSKKIFETKNKVTYYDYYIIETVNNMNYYYTLTGNKFYESL